MIKKFETVPRNNEMSFKTVVENFKAVGYHIRTIRLYDAPFGETFGVYTTTDADVFKYPEPIIQVRYDTDTCELLIITC